MAILNGHALSLKGSAQPLCRMDEVSVFGITKNDSVETNILNLAHYRESARPSLA